MRCGNVLWEDCIGVMAFSSDTHLLWWLMVPVLSRSDILESCRQIAMAAKAKVPGAVTEVTPIDVFYPAVSGDAPAQTASHSTTV